MKLGEKSRKLLTDLFKTSYYLRENKALNSKGDLNCKIRVRARRRDLKKTALSASLGHTCLTGELTFHRLIINV